MKTIQQRIGFGFFFIVFASILFVSGGTVAEEDLDLAGFGPYEVGFKYFEVVDPDRPTRVIPVHVWYPTPDISNGNEAIYTLRPLLQTPPLPPTPLQLSSQLWEPYIGRKVYEDVPVVPGMLPLLVNSHGGGDVGWSSILSAVKFASWGYVFAAPTHLNEGNLGQPPLPPPPLNVQFENRDRDVKYILDVFLDHVDPIAEEFTIDPDKVFGGGHSFGGRTMVAVTSTFPELGLEPETRFKALTLFDATRERLSIEQMAGNFIDAIMFSQECRDLQQELQFYLGSNPDMITPHGWTEVPSIYNHVLFSQICMNFVDVLGITQGLPNFLSECFDPDYRALQKDVSDITAKYTLAYFFTKMGESGYQSFFTPGYFLNNEPNAQLIMAPTGQTSVPFCDQPGESSGIPLVHGVVCHNGMSMDVPVATIEEHLAHGDTTGGCSFVEEYLTLGTFPNPGGAFPGLDAIRLDRIAQDASPLSEATILPEEGQTVGSRTILRAQASDTTLNLNTVFAITPANLMAYAFVYVTNTTGDYLPVDVAFASDDSAQVLVRGLSSPAVCSDAGDDPSDGCEVAIVNLTVLGTGLGDTVGTAGAIRNRGAVTLSPGVSLITVKVFNGVLFNMMGLPIGTRGWGTRVRVEDPATQEEFRRGEIEYSVTP